MDNTSVAEPSCRVTWITVNVECHAECTGLRTAGKIATSAARAVTVDVTGDNGHARSNEKYVFAGDITIIERDA